MGIKDLLKTVVEINNTKYNIIDLGEYFEADFIENKKIVIDGLNVIYRNMYALPNNEHLTHNGKITTHIKITLQKIKYFQKRNVTMLWVFDDYYYNPLKVETLQKRKVKLGKEDINDIKKLLTLCGIKWISVKCEAEFFCSELTKGINPLYHYVLSTDTDILIRGGVMIKEIHEKNKIRYLYLNGTDIMEKLNINQKQFAKIAVMLGCDFAPKSDRIGPKSVWKKRNDVILTERQQQAVDFLCQIIDKKGVISENLSVQEPDYIELKKWLLCLGFTQI